MKDKRPRIKRELIGEVIIDEHVFTGNVGSQNAKKIDEKQTSFIVELWFDKHYYNRLLQGDENGKRIGIDEDRVKTMVLRLINDTFYYSLRVKNFLFINYDEKLTGALRVVFQETSPDGVLNVVLQFHYINKYRYEATVITAMVKNEFILSHGQYLVRLETDGTSKLIKYDNRKIIEVSSFP